MVGTYGGWAVNSLRFYAELAKLKEQTMEQKYKQGDVVRTRDGCKAIVLDSGNIMISVATWSNGERPRWILQEFPAEHIGPWPEPLTATFECTWVKRAPSGNITPNFENEKYVNQFEGKRTKVTIEEII